MSRSSSATMIFTRVSSYKTCFTSPLTFLAVSLTRSVFLSACLSRRLETTLSGGEVIVSLASWIRNLHAVRWQDDFQGTGIPAYEDYQIKRLADHRKTKPMSCTNYTITRWVRATPRVAQ